tara:strand:- start:167 stop:742 length:576 start_codon:yes stop_codon:yes gene_type:complete
LIRVKILKISYQPSTKDYYILLKEVDGDNYIPLKIGSFEAQSIALALESIEGKRPMTHDLICSLFSEIGFSLKRVIITEFIHGTFLSTIDIVSKENGSYSIDARPSDAIAIALRENAPIFISKKLIKNKGRRSTILLKSNENHKERKFLNILKVRLKNAVKSEEYEVAAKLRDKIKNIEGQYDAPSSSNAS